MRPLTYSLQDQKIRKISGGFAAFISFIIFILIWVIMIIVIDWDSWGYLPGIFIIALLSIIGIMISNNIVNYTTKYILIKIADKKNNN
jgi:hypothetical protein